MSVHCKDMAEDCLAANTCIIHSDKGVSMYRAMVGSILFLVTSTRPDMYYLAVHVRIKDTAWVNRVTMYEDSDKEAPQLRWHGHLYAFFLLA